MAAALAMGAGALGVLAAFDLAALAAPLVRHRAPRMARGAAALWALVARAGTEGRDPAAGERRRLLAAGGAAAFAGGLVVAGPAAAVALGAGGPFAVGRLLAARRRHYRRGVERGAPALALAVADALAGGHSLRGALVEAAPGVPGPAGRELTRTARELELGARTEDALEALRARVPSHAIDAIVAAALLQRRAGGDLAGLLRECARSLEDQARLDADVRAATAQARFTGLLVVVLPLGGALLAELASPGFLRGLAGSFLTAWLVGIALGLQLLAAVLMRRLGRVRE